MEKVVSIISLEELEKLSVVSVQLQNGPNNASTDCDSDGCWGDRDSCGEPSCDSVG